MFIGDSSEEEGVKTAVFVSQRNNTYTVIQFDNATACILSVGSNVKYRFPKAMGKTAL